MNCSQCNNNVRQFESGDQRAEYSYTFTAPSSSGRGPLPRRDQRRDADIRQKVLYHLL
jgi:hypothetical protein